MMVVALARFLPFQFDARGMIQIASVPLIGIDVDFQLCIGIFAHQQIIEGH
jgi:hypothetical protein